MGAVKINRATAKICYADIIDGGLNFQKGMILRPQPKAKEKKLTIKVPW